MQLGMLFNYLKEPRAGVDIEQVVVNLPEPIDFPRLQSAWEWLVNRHDILRVCFSWDGASAPAQHVLSEVSVPFEFFDCANISKESQDKRLASFLEDDRLAGFDLSQAPLLRLALFKWGEASCSLVWTFHHALMDGRCYPVLLRELFDAYAELETGVIADRPVPPKYRRYIEWLEQRDFSSADAFWKELLAGFTAPTPLMVDRRGAAPKEVGPHGEMWNSLDTSTTHRLRELAQAHELTVNTLVMGAWAILLHRYANANDVVFGATRACRDSSIADAGQIIGLFINTVPVRVQFSGNDSALSIFKDIRAQWLAMRPYEHMPLARVKSVSQVAAGVSLFDTLVVFENQRLDATMASQGSLWRTRQVDLHELTNFAATLAAYDGDQLSFKIEFDRRRLEDEIVRRMLGHFKRLLLAIASDIHSTADALPLLTDAEREYAIHGRAATPASALGNDETVHTIFEKQAALTPDAPALTCEEKTLTYRELNARANQLAHYLIDAGVGSEVLVGLCVDRNIDLVVAILAILKAGGAYLPIDLSYPADRVAFMLDDAHVNVLVTQKSLLSSLPQHHARAICLDEIGEILSARAATNPQVVVKPENLAYVIYTSGSTGKPKGCMIAHRNVARLMRATEPWFGFNERDVWTLFHSSAFDFSVWEIWGALLYGGRLVVIPFLVTRSPEAFYELLAREQVTVLNQTPSAFRQLIQAEESVGQRALALRYVIFGGEALEMQSLRPWFDRHGDEKPKLINMYGITETTVHVTYRPLSRLDLSSGSVIGEPIPDLRLYILDGNKRPVPIGVPGELHVGGAGLARGYLNRAELTAERFIPDHLTEEPGSRLYKTGDLARFLENGDLEYLGRVDEQVKIRGFRIELGEIESVLRQHPAVREVSVMAREDVPGTKRLVAYLVTDSPAPGVAELREHLKPKLPEYMIPAAFVFLEKLPLTNNGKIDRKMLPVPEQQRPEMGSAYIAPRTANEKKLADVWSKVLRVGKIGVNDNFFELGGDSILSIQIIATARREGLKLTPKLLFAHQTIAELAAVAEVAETSTGSSEIVFGDAPLTPIQHWFVVQNLDEPHHYNQAFLFEVAEKMERHTLERALQELSRQHDSLRLRFVREGSGWRQFYSASESSPILQWNDLANFPNREQRRRAIESAAISTEAGLNLECGPLWQAAYFSLPLGEPDRLLIVVHHLAVDGVSWRPLLEDLEMAYQQLKSGDSLLLPGKTASYKNWAEHLKNYAGEKSVREELPFWLQATDGSLGASTSKLIGADAPVMLNTEGSSKIVKAQLTTEETLTLLQRIPAAYNTRINDVLLTAFARAWSMCGGSRVLFTNLEGHGRESLFEDMDLSRTVGWFTSIFPVRIEIPESAGEWQPGEALKSVKEQLLQIPQRGIGYGILRYLGDEPSLQAAPEPPVLFNYLGQFDQVTAGSKLFRFARESAGPWHSPKQRRRYPLEINSMVVGDRLEIICTHGSSDDVAKLVANLADEFAIALRELIAHCSTPEAKGRTPSDFPLAKLDQPTLDRLFAQNPDLEDVYPLSPIQTLFFSANPGGPSSAFDQWHCTLRGTLNVPALQRAWQETLRWHPILRSTIHGDRLREPLQIVHRDVRLPWRIEDWRGAAVEQQTQRWVDFLKEDRANGLSLTDAPAMRFALVRFSEDTWKFVWSVPPLLLDGWSWPVVYRDASRLYEAISQGLSPQLEPGRNYRSYIEWLGKQPPDGAQAFWREHLAGFRAPTAFSTETPEPNGHHTGASYLEHAVELSPEATNALNAAARSLRVTLGSLLLAAWSLELNRQSGAGDIVFGAAFSGRPADLRGVESIVGPFVNNLPMRVAVNDEAKLVEFLADMHAQSLRLSAHQFTPLMEIQACSEVPWKHRLFDSVVVFQNYLVDESARRMGSEILVSDFVGPIHTNYPVMFLVEPGDSLRFTLIYDSRVIGRQAVERWARDLTVLLEKMPQMLKSRVADLQAYLSSPPAAPVQAKLRLRAESQNFVPPQTEMERAISGVWQGLFGLDRVSVEDNFFDLGGHSLLLVQMHNRLRETLGTEFPVVTLFEYPTVRLLARYLDKSEVPAGNGGAKESARDRAQRQKRAMEELRSKLGKA
jgi:amino acid adenylation domain-containing protein/non-ribosomal peptide synthase protein (TIGR01720 family)